MRLRHLIIPLYATWLATLTFLATAGIAAIRVGVVVEAIIAWALAAAMAAVVVWRWRVAPRGHDIHAAYRDMEAAIDAAPTGELRYEDTILVALPSRLMPELRRFHDAPDPLPATDTLISDAYTLTWVAPLVLRHTGTDEPTSLRDLAQYAWHTIHTGQTFASAEELRTLSAQLRAARPTDQICSDREW